MHKEQKSIIKVIKELAKDKNWFKLGRNLENEKKFKFKNRNFKEI